MGDIFISLFVLVAFLALSVAFALPFIMMGMFLVGLGFRVCGKYDKYLAFKRKFSFMTKSNRSNTLINEDGIRINPASGLMMTVGNFDSAGNAYGASQNLSDWDK